VKEDVNVERMLVSGVALDRKADRVAVIGLKDEPGIAFKVFDCLAKKHINVDVILQSIGRDGTKDISFTVDDGDLEDTVAALQESRGRLSFDRIESETKIAKLSIVGAGMISNPGVAAKMFETLYNENININMIWFDSQGIVLTPNYFNQMLFANNTGSRYIDTGITTKGIYSSASVDEESQSIYVKIVNVNAFAMDVNLAFDGFGKINASSMQYMSGQRAAYNAPDMTTVAPMQVDCAIDGNSVSTRVDGQSINIIRIYYGDNDGSSAYNLPYLPQNMQNEITQFDSFVMTPEFGFAVGIIGVSVLIALVFAVLARINKKLIYKKAGIK